MSLNVALVDDIEPPEQMSYRLQRYLINYPVFGFAMCIQQFYFIYQFIFYYNHSVIVEVKIFESH